MTSVQLESSRAQSKSGGSRLFILNKEGNEGAGLVLGAKVYFVYYAARHLRLFTPEEYELEEKRRQAFSAPMVAQRPMIPTSV